MCLTLLQIGYVLDIAAIPPEGAYGYRGGCNSAQISDRYDERIRGLLFVRGCPEPGTWGDIPAFCLETYRRDPAKRCRTVIMVLREFATNWAELGCLFEGSKLIVHGLRNDAFFDLEPHSLVRLEHRK
jgi:hypothetical protein